MWQRDGRCRVEAPGGSGAFTARMQSVDYDVLSVGSEYRGKAQRGPALAPDDWALSHDDYLTIRSPSKRI
jgi:hypothetical protein